MTWHATDDVIDRYLTDRLDAARCASVEQHLVACSICRSLLASSAATDAVALEAVWDDVVDIVDRPRALPVEWFLRRVGVHDHVARLLAATPSLALPWLAGLVLTLAAAVLLSGAASGGAGTPILFMVVAPVLPLIGIGAAYGPGIDPLFDLVRAAPVPSARLFLHRAVAVLITSIGLAVVASPFLPVGGWAMVLWLLPALAASGVALALSTWLTPSLAAVCSTVAWFLAVTLSAVAARGEAGAWIDRLVVYRPAGQLACLCVMAAAAAVFVVRFDKLDAVRWAGPTDAGV